MSYHSYTHNHQAFRGIILVALFSVLTVLTAVTVIPRMTTPVHAEEGTSTPDTTDILDQESTDSDETDGTAGTDAQTTDETKTPADDPNENSSATEDGSVITTGDAASTLDQGTEVNTNDTSVNTETANQTETNNENTAAVENDGVVEAATGENTIETTGSASVQTGNALSVANIVNVVNTNIFNSNGLLYFLNALMGNIALDLRTLFEFLSGAPSTETPCSLTDCQANGTISVSNQNAATVDTNLSVVASTGGNNVQASGDAAVTTGDAYAAANVVNVVNTNIVESNYLLLTVNNFGAFGGDIIFPGADWFRDLFQNTTPGGTVSVANENTATVTNTGTVVAETGDNTTSGEEASITTGSSTAAATIVNQVNTNIAGDSFSLLFRVHGSWAGNVFGLPEGMGWREGPEGIEIFFTPDARSQTQGSTGNLTIENANTAEVRNNVSVYALTGDNQVASETGEASVDTGNAYAAANIVNVVNSNILGRNWVLAIFNIFGDWNGNISFGQPDLWVGARALAPARLSPGTCFAYEITVNNLGDAVAERVTLTGSFDRTLHMIDGIADNMDGRVRLDVGRIEPRGSKLLTLNTCIPRTIAAGDTITSTFTATSPQGDAQAANNTDVISVTTSPAGTGASAFRDRVSDITVEKTANTEVTTASTSVGYTIVIRNNGGPLYNALLVDTIYNTKNVPMHEQRWGLGTIAPGEEITITYSTFFNGSTTPGTYTNEAFVFGTDRHPDTETHLGNPTVSPKASAVITVRENETDIDEPEIAGAAIGPNSCSPLLTTYIRYGADNNTRDVRKLQAFLRLVEHDSSIELNDQYDQTTYEAVRRFQVKYATDILEPWGQSHPTGYVYYTTQKKINELWCNTAFPLAPDQVSEIETYRARTEGNPVVPTPRTEYDEVGMIGAPATPRVELSQSETTEQVEAESANEIAQAIETAEQARGFWQGLKHRLSSMFGK